MWQALVLALSFPVMGLLLFALTMIENRLPGGPPRASPREPAGHTGERASTGRPKLVLWPTDRFHHRGLHGGQPGHAAAADGQRRKAS